MTGKPPLPDLKERCGPVWRSLERRQAGADPGQHPASPGPGFVDGEHVRRPDRGPDLLTLLTARNGNERPDPSGSDPDVVAAKLWAWQAVPGRPRLESRDSIVRKRLSA